jgi:hypothetical protein
MLLEKAFGVAAEGVFAAKIPGPANFCRVVFLKKRTLSPAVEAFIDCTREVAKSLVRAP